jgi:hypothetical protein
MNRITRFEWQILSLFLAAVIVNISFFHMTVVVMGAFYLLGLLFEFITEPLWSYDPHLRESPLTLKSRDINLLFGLAWVAVVIFSLSLAKVLDRWMALPLVNGIACFLIVGNIMETLFFRFGNWTYATAHPLLRFPPLLGPYIEVGKIPLTVRLGYAVLGTAAFFINKYLSAILG